MTPIYLILFFQDVKRLHQVNIYIQGFLLAILCIGILIYAILIPALDLPHYYCNKTKLDIQLDVFMHPNEKCESHLRLWLWIYLLIFATLTVPLQYLFYSIFKEHAEDMREGAEAE